MNTLLHHVVISLAVGSRLVLNGAANRDPFVLNHFFAQGILFSDQIIFLYINEVADRDLSVMSGL